MRIIRKLLKSFGYGDSKLYYQINKKTTDLYELVLVTDHSFVGMRYTLYSYDYKGSLKYSILDCTISKEKILEDIKMLEKYKNLN
jgi:hypothetical protein